MKFRTILVVLAGAILLGCQNQSSQPTATDTQVGDVTNQIDTSSLEATMEETAPDPCNIKFTFADGKTIAIKSVVNGVNKWTCNIDHECVLKLVQINGGKICAVSCPKGFTVRVPDEAKLVSDVELAYQIPNFEPQSCILQQTN